MKNLHFLKLFSAFTMLIILFSCSGNKNDLKLNLQKGQNFLMTYQTDMKMNQKIMGMSIDIKMNMTMDIDFEVIDFDKDSNYLMKVSYQTIAYKMKTQGQNIEFGSEIPSNDSKIGDIFKKIKGLSFEMKLNKSGGITEVKGFENITQTLFSGNALDSSGTDELKDLFNKNFGEESIKNNFSSFFNFYPEKPVKTGDKWQNKNSIVSFFALNLENNYQLTDKKDNKYKIDIQSNIKTDSKNAIMKIKGMEMKFDMKGTQSGFISIDQKNGWITESEIIQKIEGSASMSKNGMPGGGNFAIPYSMETTMKVSQKK